MRLVTYGLLAAILVTTVLVVTACGAEELYKMKVISRGPKTKDVVLHSISGTRKELIMTIDACGTVMEFSGSSKNMESPGFQAFATKEIERACGY